MGRTETREYVVPYSPRPLQARIHDGLKRFNVLVLHRRFGKTVLAINELIRGAATCQLEAPRLAYVAPLRIQAKEIAWDYLKRFTEPITDRKVNESELRVDLPWGARITLYGADNPDSLRGIYLDGVVLDEYAQMQPKAWSEVIRPALADRQGWAIFIGTPKGQNHFKDVYERAKGEPEWFAAMYRASETKVIHEAELQAARREMDEAEYLQEFECSFQAALVGAYYGKEMASAEADKRICSVPWEPGVPVWTAWDLGVDDLTAIWCVQQVGREVHVVDYYENSGAGLDHYVSWLRAKPYAYATHILPHDAAAKELGTGKSRIETLASLGMHNTKVVPALSVMDGINAVRQLLPKCWFDATKCAQGVKALQNYQREWNDKLGTFRASPRHDWASHGADAFRYLAMGLKPDSDAWGKELKQTVKWVV